MTMDITHHGKRNTNTHRKRAWTKWKIWSQTFTSRESCEEKKIIGSQIVYTVINLICWEIKLCWKVLFITIMLERKAISWSTFGTISRCNFLVVDSSLSVVTQLVYSTLHVSPHPLQSYTVLSEHWSGSLASIVIWLIVYQIERGLLPSIFPWTTISSRP